MKTIFRVSDLDFIDSEKEQLSFIPAPSITDKFSDKDLLRQIFTEDIGVEPEPPIYPDVIQKLIDENAQNPADVAKILNLYNPADISDILKKLIASNPQPTTAEQVATNDAILAYPYQYNSAIYDYKFLNWTKLGDGNIEKNNTSYLINNCGIQFQNIFPSTASTIEINLTINPYIDTTKTFITLYTSLSTTSTAAAGYTFAFDSNLKKYTASRRSSNNGTTTNSDNNYTENNYSYNQDAELKLLKYSDGTVFIRNKNNQNLAVISSTSNFNPRSIRINISRSSTISATNTILIKNFQLKIDNQIISSWNKI